ncbi:hypothetical protein KFU94_01045 [Chloroflexi bacterium TSY]|nr:hypothetical protein [Chloroflexi bacterium TSY]
MTDVRHPRTYPYIFVLWGDKFEEAPAALFTIKLREAGLRVSVVGLGGRCAEGIHGLTLYSDLTLDQALLRANKATCIIIPCRSIHRLGNAPRIRDLIYQAHRSNAKFVIGQVDESNRTYQNFFPVSTPEIAIYPDDIEEQVRFIDQIASLLQGSPQ